MRLSLGYPHPDVEKKLLMSGAKRTNATEAEAVIQPEQLIEMQQAVEQVVVSDSLVSYILSLLLETRQSPELIHGLSPRAGLALTQAAKAIAWLSKREFVIPEDVQQVFAAVVGHRLQPTAQSSMSGQEVAESLLQTVAVPL